MVKIRVCGKIIPKEDIWKHELKQDELKRIIVNRSGRKQKKGA